MSTDERSLVPTIGYASYRILRTYADKLSEKDLDIVREQLPPALRSFPALNGHTVSVGRIPPSVELRGDPVARARPWNHLIELPIDGPPSNMTLWHELAHLAIYQRYRDGDDSVSRTSEEYTSLYAVARMEPDQIFSDRIPYFGEPDAPADEWPRIATDALWYRAERGKHSRYLDRAREQFFDEGGEA